VQEVCNCMTHSADKQMHIANCFMRPTP